ncbi:hypothetical protein LZ31DRAFT_121395 [Colletotrichum somersetense]|nr:hypothetical protein LZ31DRAFT_121395 [Colletotrichum somersetense]
MRHEGVHPSKFPPSTPCLRRHEKCGMRYAVPASPTRRDFTKRPGVSHVSGSVSIKRVAQFARPLGKLLLFFLLSCVYFSK